MKYTINLIRVWVDSWQAHVVNEKAVIVFKTETPAAKNKVQEEAVRFAAGQKDFESYLIQDEDNKI
jgi:hypothetical protein